MKKIILLIMAAALSSCDSNTKFITPTNIFSEWCSTKLKMSNATVYCSEGEYNLSESVNRSLVVFVEAGSAHANSTTLSPFSGIMNNPEISSIAPHIRTIIGNIASSFIEKNQLKYSRYDSIFVVQGDSGLKDRFKKAIEVAAQKSSSVDLFIMGHGSPGILLMNQDLNSNGEALSGNEISKFGNSLTADARNKVKNIFSTACFSATASLNSMSVADGFMSGFPQSKSYGGAGTNYFPLHRDFTIFEEFQKSQDFSASVARGNQAISQNIYSGTKRNYITYPSVRGRGCVDLFFTEKCKEMVLPMGTMSVSPGQIKESLAVITSVRSVASITPIATPIATPTVTLAPAGTPRSTPTPIVTQPNTPVANPTLPSTPSLSNVIGYVDGISSTGNTKNLWGWACSERIAQSLDLHIYVETLAGSPRTFVGYAKANQSSESAVAEACHVTSGQYRFNFLISDDIKTKYAGAKFFVYGISPVGRENSALTGSGNFTVPSDEKAVVSVLSYSLDGPAQTVFRPNAVLYGKVTGLPGDHIASCVDVVGRSTDCDDNSKFTDMPKNGWLYDGAAWRATIKLDSGWSGLSFRGFWLNKTTGKKYGPYEFNVLNSSRRVDSD